MNYGRPMSNKDQEQFEEFIDTLIFKIIEDFEKRVKMIEVDLYHSETSEVIGGLLSRQATLVIEMASAPSIWNGHVAPLILRTMTDLHITLAWILDSPVDKDEKAKKYILYGLGQAKLLIEHYKEHLKNPENEDSRTLLDLQEAWLSSQRLEFLTAVNVGSWSNLDTRKMAQEVGCENLYKFAFTPFSSVVHNTWNHISLYNMVPCSNPLHKNHRHPSLLTCPLDIDYLYRAVKYFDKTLKLRELKYE